MAASSPSGAQRGAVAAGVVGAWNLMWPQLPLAWDTYLMESAACHLRRPSSPTQSPPPGLQSRLPHPSQQHPDRV